MSGRTSLEHGSAVDEKTALVRRLVLLSGFCLVLQVGGTDYGVGSGGGAAAVLWCAIGFVLLWLVYRERSRVARGVLIVTALAGTVIFALAAIEDPVAGLLALLYLGQALPLLTRTLRQHVRSD